MVVLVILAAGTSLFLLLSIHLILAIFLMLPIWGGIASLFPSGPAEGNVVSFGCLASFPERKYTKVC